MEERDKIIKYKKKQRAKFLKRLQTIEPILKEKEDIKKQVEKAIEQQELIKRKTGEKFKQQLDAFKELRKAYPELSDSQFNEYARKQLGLDIPVSYQSKLDEPQRQKLLKEKLKKAPKQTIIPEEKDTKQEIELKRQKTEKEQQEKIKENRKIQILDAIKKITDNYNIQQLEKKYYGKGNQGPKSDKKDAYLNYTKLKNELLSLGDKIPTSGITKITKSTTATTMEQKEQKELKEPIEEIPEATETIEISPKKEELNRQLVELLAQLEGAADDNTVNQLIPAISMLNDKLASEDPKQSKMYKDELKKSIDNYNIKKREYEMMRPVEKEDKMDLFTGKGLRKITRKNIQIFHIPHKQIKEKQDEFVLTGKGLKHAKNLAKILHPMEFEKVLKYSIINHIRNKQK